MDYKQCLVRIANQLSGIAIADMTKAEREITSILVQIGLVDIEPDLCGFIVQSD